jgi:F-type H+-transporting ATPase subunit b
MESIVSAFHIDWKAILGEGVNFAVVFTVLYIFAIKPLQKLMAERSEKIEKGVRDAKENAHLRAQAQVEYEKALTKAREDANRIFQRGQKGSGDETNSDDGRGQSEAASIVTGGKKHLKPKKIKMVEDAKKRSSQLGRTSCGETYPK